MSDACQVPTIKNLKDRLTIPVLLSPSNSRNVFCRLECRRSKHNILSSPFTKSQKNKCTCSWYQVSPKACCEQVIQHSREPELHKQNSLAKLRSKAWNYSTRIKLCSILLSNCSCTICPLLRLDLIVTLPNWSLWGSESCWTSLSWHNEKQGHGNLETLKSLRHEIRTTHHPIVVSVVQVLKKKYLQRQS